MRLHVQWQVHNGVREIERLTTELAESRRSVLFSTYTPLFPPCRYMMCVTLVRFSPWSTRRHVRATRISSQ